MRLSAIRYLIGYILVASMSGSTIVTTTNATNLVNEILGPGVTLVGTPTLVGVNNQQGIFSGALFSVGLSEGIVLSTGDVTGIFAPNETGSFPNNPETIGSGDPGGADVNTDLALSGDADLTTLAGGETEDANILSFDFNLAAPSDIFFNFVFASEEYIDFVNSPFNDVFAFFLDGENLAVIGTDPISINTVNPLTNSGSYVNNVPNTGGFPNANRPIRFDGMTVVLTAKKLGLAAGQHSISLRIADTSDGLLDSAVFIQKGSFSTTPTPVGNVPEPGTVALAGIGLGLLAFYRAHRKA